MEKNTDIAYLKGVGPNLAKLFYKLSIETLSDLLFHIPRRYEDRRETRPIASLSEGESACFEGVALDVSKPMAIRKGLTVVRARVRDESGIITLSFFNAPYIPDQLKCGEEYRFYGRITVNNRALQVLNPVFEHPESRKKTGCIVPIYPLTARLQNHQILRAISAAFPEVIDKIEETLPAKMIEKYNLMPLKDALRAVHFPSSPEEAERGQARIVLDELLVYATALAFLKSKRVKQVATPFKSVDMAPFLAALPYALTTAQQRSVKEITADMQSGRPLNRLLQGDVGSGKTVVAMAAAFTAVKNQKQVALMAPTTILANQHYADILPLFEAFGIRMALLTSDTPKKQQNQIIAAIKARELDFIVGTQSLISDAVEYADLGLIICDEQHRFGVRQRAKLGEKGEKVHTLVMSATPIPRTLALSLYGDLDVSLLDELPPGRQKVKTFLVPPAKRQGLYDFMRQETEKGRQCYLVCPLIEEQDEESLASDMKSVLTHAKELAETSFKGIPMGILHGKMKEKEKDAVMLSFARGELSILVSTTVIEIGVNVPNATVMVIENAERYGLSSLHQLRGRVGRGTSASFCFLLSENSGEQTLKRLQVICGTNDGFAIAEQDLATRGIGDIFGSRQHGLMNNTLSGCAVPQTLFANAAAIAKEILAADPKLQNPENQPFYEKMLKYFTKYGENIFN